MILIDMAEVVTVRIVLEPGRRAMDACAAGAGVVFTGSGGDVWATDGSGDVSVERSFELTVESNKEEDL